MRYLAILFVLGCGSAAKPAPRPAETPETPEEKAEREAREKREKRKQEIDAMKPPDPYEVRDKAAFAPKARCGQGPYRIETDTLKAKYGEQIRVYACGKQLKGNYRLTTTRSYGASSTSEDAFGHMADNAACKGHPVATVAPGASTSNAGGGGGGPAKARGTTAAAPEQLETQALVASTVPDACKETSIVSRHGWSAPEGGVAIDGRFVVDIWSDVPMDLDGLVFVVERRAVVADMTPERWMQYQAAYDAWYDVYKVFADEQLARGEWQRVDSRVTTPPPPKPRAETPPPKPSANARWIPGYWHYAEGQFHWLAGLWDVPEEDVKRELTVQAPTPPPPQRVEAPVAARPAVTAVWTPGSWFWDGRAYVWVPGTWRIPPAPTHTWQPPTWTVRERRAIYVPGGWRIRIGR